ncbi:hypothetical protein F0562_021684 [Nyssa sinensis]|uniref:Uncharacterized protein n=1 Tax=Nyssa sinensis TaxID=561372 RepID=A0A5J5BN52_9ASTE|nr:hypothetical protein F0562_021684 [Nyssa sinensis]
MTPQRLSLNPSSVKTRFACGFLRSLKRLNRHRPASTSSASAREICRRYRLIKRAADASMASAVGSRRAWSRAMLWKIHNRAGRRHALENPRSCGHHLRKRVGKKHGEEFGLFQEKQLRKLVPGGEAMDSQSLLDETAHYIKCLSTQVQIGNAEKAICISPQSKLLTMASSENIDPKKPPPPKNPNEKFLNYAYPFNPFRIDNGDNPAVALVLDLLTADNYVSWSRAVSRALRAKNKLGFINGTIS